MNQAPQSLLNAKNHSVIGSTTFPFFQLHECCSQDTLSDKGSIDLSLPEIRSQIFLLAEQHVAGEKLQQLYWALSASYTLCLSLHLTAKKSLVHCITIFTFRRAPARGGGLGLPKDQARTMMHLLALKKVEPGTTDCEWSRAHSL